MKPIEKTVKSALASAGLAASLCLAVAGFMASASPVSAADCGANQTCKHPCVVGTEFDTGTICNNQGWTCCETVQQVNLTPVVNTAADCTGKGGQCVTWGGTCPAGLIQSNTCDDKSPVEMCCTPQNAPAATPAAQPGTPIALFNPLCPGGGTCNVTLISLLSRFVSAFLGIVGALALLVFVYAGVMYMTAGSSDRVKKSTETMKYAVIGLGAIMLAYLLTDLFVKALTANPPTPPKPKASVTLPTQ